MLELNAMHELIGKEVEVSTGDIFYKGVLVEILETEVQLQSEYGWITIPFENIANIKAVD